MKNINKIIIMILVVASLGSCAKDWLDINKSPNAPTKPELSQLLSYSEHRMSMAVGHDDFISNALSSYVHQANAREVQNYSMGTQANNPYNTWNYLYLYSAKNFDEIVKFAETDDNMIYAGIAKTLKAYTFSVLVDLWGDVPYSEFNVDGVTAPKADSGKDIYNAIIALLEEAAGDLSNTSAANLIKPGTDDFFYGGNTARWIKLNNTLRLKLLLQSRKAKSDITDWQGKLNALTSANNFIASGEDFQFLFPGGTNPQDMRHPAFTDGYTGQHTFYLSPYFYETMMGETYNTIDNPFAGIQDPRVPYYFYRQLAPGQASENAHEYRNGEFMSIFFASNGPNSARTNDGANSKIGIYACGGKYDDGKGGRVSLTTGNGIAPQKIISFSCLKFMLAELALVGDYSGDAKTLLQEGITASIAHVNTVAGYQSGTPTIAAAARDEFITDVLEKYDNADANGKMRILITQKWIANFMSPLDSYNDIRRTGYPILFDPQKTENPGFGVNPTVADLSPGQVPLLNFASFPRSLYYPANSETELNPNLQQKTNISTPFVFWDK
jgi:hypothetical protein